MADETPNVAAAAVLLNVAEAAVLLNVAEKAVDTTAQNSELPCFKVRGQWCFGAAGSGHAPTW